MRSQTLKEMRIILTARVKMPQTFYTPRYGGGIDKTSIADSNTEAKVSILEAFAKAQGIPILTIACRNKERNILALSD